VAKQRDISGKPVFVWLLGRREEAFRFKAEALSYRIPVFDELYRAVECLSAVFHQRQMNEITTTPPVQGETASMPVDLEEIFKTTVGPLNEYESKRILKAHGIPTVEEEIVADTSICENAACQMGFPVVMKGLLPGGVHKTEMGLVHLNVTTPAALCQVFDTLKSKMGPSGQVLIYKQVKGKIEIIAGLVRDLQFGPCVMLGLGGIMTDVFEDVIFAMAPLTQIEALQLIGRIRGQKLLNGFRGEPPVDRDELASILVKLGNLGIKYPRIQEIDVNPLIIGEQGPVAVDATIVLG
jgi:acetate---CoA ligase (ADP-forming)